MEDQKFPPEDVLDLWFPEDGFWESEDNFSVWIRERMYGGMDDIICQDFAEVTRAAARSELDHWSETAEGRIALIEGLTETLISEMPAPLATLGDRLRARNGRCGEDAGQSARSPRAPAHSGRVSSAEEEAYIATGDFPHVARPDLVGG